VVNQLLGKKTDLTLPSEDSLVDTLEKFSKFFDSKIINIRKKLDEAGLTNHNKNTVLPLPVPQTAPSLEFFHQLSIEEITKLIKASPTKSCKLDPLPTHLLKDCLEALAPAITNVVNLSLAESTFPQEMKQALVTPLIKKPTLNKEVLSNYRPVSNLSFLSKVTEKAVAKQLTEHMTTHKLHVPIQSAYRQNHSTETALLKVLNDILVSVDKGDGVILILLDLSAAFDTIDHNMLIDRLGEQIGVKGPALAGSSHTSPNVYKQSMSMVPLHHPPLSSLEYHKVRCWGQSSSLCTSPHSLISLACMVLTCTYMQTTPNFMCHMT
jgi:hypothetical protein